MHSFKISAAIVATALISMTTGQYSIDPDSVPLTTRRMFFHLLIWYLAYWSSNTEQWCTHQTETCPFICSQNSTGSTTTETNSCDAVSRPSIYTNMASSNPQIGTKLIQKQSSLTYECICGNGLSPNASEYSLTLPYFICTQYSQDCVANCNGDNTCSAACLDDHPCGAQNPTRINVTSTSTTGSATGTAGASSTNAVAYTGLGGSSASTSTPKSGAQMTMDFGRSYGLAVVFAGVFAGFALVL